MYINLYSHCSVFLLITRCSSVPPDVFLSQHHELWSRLHGLHGHHQQLHQLEPSHCLPCRHEHGVPKLQPQWLPTGLHGLWAWPHVPLPSGFLPQLWPFNPAQYSGSTLPGLLAPLSEHGSVHEPAGVPHHCYTEPGRP